MHPVVISVIIENIGVGVRPTYLTSHVTLNKLIHLFEAQLHL